MGNCPEVFSFFDDFFPISYQFHTFLLHFPECLFGNFSQFTIFPHFPPSPPPHFPPFPPLSHFLHFSEPLRLGG